MVRTGHAVEEADPTLASKAILDAVRAALDGARRAVGGRPRWSEG